MIESELSARRVVFVTGPSGAGRSSALNVLEDAGFEVVDNLPLRLLPVWLEGASANTPLALGVDPRNRDFSVARVTDALVALAELPDVAPELLFLDCSEEVLLRRYSETRRRHPLAPDDRPSDGIARELEILIPLRAQADVLIDTSELNVHQLREEVEHWFARGGKRHLSVSFQSFSYKRGLPRSADMVFDCRFLDNPYWQPGLRALNGRDVQVQTHVKADERFEPFVKRVVDLCLDLLPAYRDEGKSYLSVAFGCTGGQHRSVVMAETLSLRLAESGWQVSIRHRELELREKAEA
ncbi:MAG: RNase adapter RapZ [Pseudomonadota bacterium]